MERFDMGQEELDKLNWLKRAKDGVITQRKAAEKIGVTDRWVREMLARLEKHGDGVVILPAEDRVWLHDPHTAAPTRPASRQQNPQESVGALQTQATGRVALKDRQLVTQGENLSLQGGAGPKSAAEAAEEIVYRHSGQGNSSRTTTPQRRQSTRRMAYKGNKKNPHTGMNSSATRKVGHSRSRGHVGPVVYPSNHAACQARPPKQKRIFQGQPIGYEIIKPIESYSTGAATTAPRAFEIS